MKKFTLLVTLVAIVVLVAAALSTAPAQAGTSEHCPDGGLKHEGSYGDVTLDGVTIAWDGANVNVSGGEAQICVKAATRTSGAFWLSGSWHVWWLNDGGQTPDISYLVVYGVKTPTPPTPTVTPTPKESEYEFEMEGHRDCIRWSISEVHAPSEGVMDVSMDPAWTAEWLPNQDSITVKGKVEWSDGHTETDEVTIFRPEDCDGTATVTVTSTPPTVTVTTVPPTTTVTTVPPTPPTVTTVPPQETPHGVVESAPATGVEFPLWPIALPLGAAVFFWIKKHH